MILLFQLVCQSLNFFVDPVVYRSSIEIADSTLQQKVRLEDIFYVEFNCAIPYQELCYEELDKKIIARAIINFSLKSLERPDSLVDTLYRQFTIPSFSQAMREEISFIVQFGLYIPAGQYQYQINLLSGNKRGERTAQLNIQDQDYKISDLLIASSITADTAGACLTKGNLKVIPHPSKIFNEQYKNLYVYYEVYNFSSQAKKLVSTYSITDQQNKIIRKVTRELEKRFKTQAINLGLSIQNITPGEYIFTVEVYDSVTNQSAKKAVPIKITKRPEKEISYEGLKYYEEIEYFVSPQEYKYFQSLTKEGKALYLRKFWDRSNYYEIAERFEYADRYYREGNKPGRKTDRGRVYVKFGTPDEVEKTTIDIEISRPYEHWYYYNGIQFIFVDIRSTNEYTLVWTNAPTERSQPTLYDYLPAAKRREVEQH